MSLLRGCETIELESGKWFCVVATDEYDYDFRHATAYGPCPTAAKAEDLMSDNESNPGGGGRTSNEHVTDYHRALLARA